MTFERNHYYDGKFYETIIDPVLSEVREIISSCITDNSKVLDIGCGTWALVFELAEKCKSLVGVELSSKMNYFANQKNNQWEYSNIDFLHTNATKLSQFHHKEFDFAIISMVIHETAPKSRIWILKEAQRVAKKIIIADYIVPQSWNISWITVRLAEFFAWFDHFSNFLNYQKNDWLNPILNKLNLKIKGKITNKNKTIYVLEVE